MKLSGNVKFIGQIALLLTSVLLLQACGSGSTDTDIDAGSQIEIDKGTDTDVDTGSDTGQTESLTASSFFDQNGDQLPSKDFKAFLSLDPIKEQRCAFPEQEEFTKLADQLGGFPRPYNVRRARNMADPHYYTGFPPDRPMAEDVAANPDKSLSIDRADLIGHYGNTAFYLAKPHGFIAVSIDPTDASQSTVSCYFTLPGRPINFYTQNNQIFILINSFNGRDSAILNLSWQASGFEYKNSLFLKDRRISDSRRFTESDARSRLALFGSYYLPLQDQEENNNEADVLPRPSFHNMNHLTFVDLETLTETEKEIYDRGEREYFNTFLSASDRYLVLSKQHSELLRYETRKYSVCTERSEPIIRKVCYTNWKRVANPDYEPPAPGGVISCGNDLMACLKEKGPKLPRYIRVADGETCVDVPHSYCTNYEYKSYEYPIYQPMTQFVVYRYQQGSFIKLDERLSKLEENELFLSEETLQVAGRISDHRFMQFQNGFFYVLSSTGDLTTYTIQGNSFIQTSQLTGLADDNSIQSVLFSGDSLWYGTQARALGALSQVDLSEPHHPKRGFTLKSPGYYEQLIVDDEYLLGFGSVDVNSDIHAEKISLLSRDENTLEQDHYLAGTDYRYTSSPAHGDDQAYLYDYGLQRLFLPLYSSGFIPFEGYQSVNRLFIADREANLFAAPQVLDLEYSVDRSLSVEENLALAFSGRSVTALVKESEWRSISLQEISIPREAYSVPGTDIWIVREDHKDYYSLRSNRFEELFNRPGISSLEVKKPERNVCYSATLLFADNMVLSVGEKANQFQLREDCIHPLPVESLEIKGWLINGEGSMTEADSEVALSMYKKVQQAQDTYCVFDADSFDGEHVNASETTIPDDVYCMDLEEFNSNRQ